MLPTGDARMAFCQNDSWRKQTDSPMAHHLIHYAESHCNFLNSVSLPSTPLWLQQGLHSFGCQLAGFMQPCYIMQVDVCCALCRSQGQASTSTLRFSDFNLIHEIWSAETTISSSMMDFSLIIVGNVKIQNGSSLFCQWQFFECNPRPFQVQDASPLVVNIYLKSKSNHLLKE